MPSNWTPGNFGLGLTNPPTRLDVLGLPDPYPWELTPFSEVAPNQVGGQVFLGRPRAKWSFCLLDQTQMNQLLAFISGGSKSLFIRTRVPSGQHGGGVYHTFSATMQFPSKVTPKPGGLFEGVEVEFTNLVNA